MQNTTSHNARPLETILRRVIEDTDGEDVSIRDILKLFGRRAFGPVFTLVGLLAVLPPLSGIPGFPTTMAVILLLFSTQMLLGRRHLWLPNFIASRTISKDKLRQTQDKSRKLLARIDDNIVRRLTWAAGPMATRLAAVIVTLLACIMVPLELVPFAVAVPGITVAMFGVGIFARDGLIMLIAFTFSLGAFALLYFVWPF